MRKGAPLQVKHYVSRDSPPLGGGVSTEIDDSGRIFCAIGSASSSWRGIMTGWLLDAMGDGLVLKDAAGKFVVPHDFNLGPP